MRPGQLLLLMLLFVNPAGAQKSVLRPATPHVLPWSGHRAAISITLDDGLPVQLFLAAPVLRSHNIRATYFLCMDNLELVESWKAATIDDEIGNHTLDHAHLNQISDGNVVLEIAASRAELENTFERSASSLAYPFEDSSPTVEAYAKKFATFGRGYSDDLFLTPAMAADPDFDWYSIGSQVARTSYDFPKYKAFIDEALQRGAWESFQYHGFQGNGYEAVPITVFEKTLDYLAVQKDVWIAPWGEVAAYLKAQVIFDSADVTHEGRITKYSWNIPENLWPAHVVLKVKVGTKVQDVSFDDGELSVSE
jgi:peptidoglycan/xylan/chitin deacetylase (PgdA/CDA1 family)